MFRKWLKQNKVKLDLKKIVKTLIDNFKLKKLTNIGFEVVFHYEWYDGPIRGVANKDGKPYFFQYQKYYYERKESYYLTPISEDILILVKEDWQIWKRWETAFHKNEVDITTHPYLVSDRERGESIKKILHTTLKIDYSNYLELDAEFKFKENQKNILGWKQLLVKWKPRQK